MHNPQSTGSKMASMALVPATEGHFGTKDSSTAAPVSIPSHLIGQRFDQLRSAASRAQYRRASLNTYKKVARQAVLRMPNGAFESLSA